MIKLYDLLEGTFRDPWTGIIHEGLIRTVDMPAVIRILSKKYKGDPNISATANDNIIKITLDIEYSPLALKHNIVENKKISELLILMNNLGYTPSIIKSNLNRKLNKYTGPALRDMFDEFPSWISIQFEKKYDRVIEVNKIVYHATSKTNIPRIKKYGLILKSKGKIGAHPERIYVGEDKNEIVELWPQLSRTMSDKDGVVLTIDTSLMNNPMFYIDPQYSEGVYTYTNIPPNAIIEIEPID